MSTVPSSATPFAGGLDAMIPFAGLLAQVAGTVLLATLFQVMRPYARRRHYFAAWGVGWGALAGALLALVALYVHLASTPLRAEGEAISLVVRGLLAIYLVGKFGWLLLTVEGTWSFASGGFSRRSRALGLGVAVALALPAAALLPGLNAMVAVQAPLVVAATAACALRLQAIPASRRSLGSRLTAVSFALVSGLWAIYLAAFLAAGATEPEQLLLRLVARYNSFFDLLLAMLLGFSMVILLLEDARRDLDDAYAQLELSYDQLRREALVDSLTGCLNRRAYEAARGEGWRADYGAVAVVDLDNLKTVNDTLGHAVGDRLLLHLAVTLRRHLRPTDRLFRMGGDEFLVLARRGRSADLGPRLERLLASTPLHEEGAEPLPLLASLGLADYESAERLDAAIEQADRAMYAVKRARKPGR